MTVTQNTQIRTREFQEKFENLRRKLLGKLADRFEIIEKQSAQQSRMFMIDIIPHIHRLYFDWPKGKILKVLDVGIHCGAGTALLAEVHNPKSFNYLKMEVTGIDIVNPFKDYIELCYPSVNFIQKNIFDISDDEVWDLVICSHVIEHLEEPLPFIERLRQLTSGYALIACPYNEQPLRSGHIQTINDEFIAKVNPIEHYVYTNFCWRGKGDCLIMVLD